MVKLLRLRLLRWGVGGTGTLMQGCVVADMTFSFPKLEALITEWHDFTPIGAGGAGVGL